MAYLPKWTSFVIAVHIKRQFTFTANFYVLRPDQFDAFFNPKHVSETNAIDITPSIGQLEKRTSSRATTDAV